MPRSIPLLKVPFLAPLLAALLLTAAAAGAQTEPAAAGPVQAFPAGLVYSPYTADPRSPEFALTMIDVQEVGAAESGSPRFGLKLGGRFGLLRIVPRDRPERAWQLDIEAGFVGQFDIDYSLDNLGWDGNYAFLLSHSPSDRWAFQVGGKHISSHVGDEYAERTGRLRIDYTREEVALGAVWSPDSRWRAYAEAGWNPSPRERTGQEPGRFQTGLEHSGGPVFGGERVRWYAATNLELMEERDWQLDATLQAGLRIPSGDRTWRVAVTYYDGRIPLGEFFQDDERYLILGLYLNP
jgi:hypothetical protein